MKPFFTYYGGKFRLAAKLPQPRFGRIVESFAGSAGYSTRHPHHEVTLVEKNPIIASIWRYLIGASASEIRDLPDIADGETTDLLPVPVGAQRLIGMWLNAAVASPRKSPSAWMRQQTSQLFWGRRVRDRIASQVDLIRHWQIVEGDYSIAPDVEATWIVDPPYQGRAGTHYPFGSKAIDYAALAEWTRARRGLVIAHEAHGADWLPFAPFGETKAMTHVRGTGRISVEALFVQGDAA